MADDKKKAQYAKPASQVDLEERAAVGFASNAVLSTSDEFRKRAEQSDVRGGKGYAVEGNDTENYIGVSPEYQTYSHKNEKPGASDKGAENQVMKQFAEFEKSKDEVAVTSVNESEVKDEGDEDSKGDDSKTEENKTPATPPTPPTPSSK